MTILEDEIGVAAEVEYIAPIPASSSENLTYDLPTPTQSESFLTEECNKTQLEFPDESEDSEAPPESESNCYSSEDNLSSTETLNFKDVVECKAIEPILITESKQEAHPTIDPSLYTIKEESEDQEILKQQSDAHESDDEALPPFLGRWRLKDRDGGTHQEEEVDIEAGEAAKSFWQRFIPEKVPKYWSSVVLLCVFFTLMLQSGMYYTFTVYFPELFSTFGKSRSYTSWVGSLNAAVNMLCGPISCYVITKWGCRVSIILGAIVTSSGFVLNSLAPCVESLFLSYGVVVGLGYSLIYTSSLIVLGQYFPTKLSLATTFAMMGTGVGIITLVPATQMIIDEFGWRSAYLITAAVGLFICLFGTTMFPKMAAKEEDVKSDPLECVETHKLMSWGGLTPLHQGSLWSLNLSQHQTSRSVSVINLNDPEGASLGLSSHKHSMIDILEVIQHDEEKSKLLSADDSGLFLDESCETPCAIQIQVTSPEDDDHPTNDDSSDAKVYQPAICHSAIEYLKLLLLQIRQKLQNQGILMYLSDARFWTLCFSGLMNAVGVGVFLILLKDFADNRGLSENFSLTMSALGFGDLFGRLLGGIFNSFNQVNTILYYATVQLLLSATLVYSNYTDTVLKLMIVCVCFGFICGQYNILFPQVSSAVYGVEKMADVMGYIFFFYGIGSIGGPPVGVALVDRYGDYTETIYFCASSVFIGSMLTYICYFIGLVTKTEKEVVQT